MRWPLLPRSGAAGRLGEDRLGEVKRVFSDYLRELEATDGAPAAGRFEVMWRALKARLTGELRGRGLWLSPPSFLGVHGGATWTQDRGEALEELAAECYAFVFVSRLWSLNEQLAVKDNVDGLVIRNIRNFIRERQRCHDRIGFRIFQVLRAAVRQALDRGDLLLLAGDPRIRNDSLLGRSGSSRDPASAERLAERARRWNDTLFPEIILANGWSQRKVVAALAERLVADEQAFRFKDVIDPLKLDTRQRWAMVLRHEMGETAWESEAAEGLGTIVAIGPDTRFEDRQSYTIMMSEVEGRIDQLSVSETTRDHLGNLWRFLRSYAEGSRPTAVPDELPSRRRMATLLAIPRNRLPELFDMLARLVEESRSAAISGVG